MKQFKSMKSKISTFGLASFLLTLSFFVLGPQNLTANTCQAACNHLYQCTLMQHGSNPANKARLEREKPSFLSNCVKGCTAHQAKALACYQKSGGQTNVQSCQANLMCMLPYMQSLQK